MEQKYRVATQGAFHSHSPVYIPHINFGLACDYDDFCQNFSFE